MSEVVTSSLLHATVTDLSTGEVLERLGPFESASAARTACGVAAGGPLTWTPVGLTWEARTDERVYTVPRVGVEPE